MLARRSTRWLAPWIAAVLLALLAPVAHGQEDLATKTQNPIANLISVPFQLTATFDQGAEGDTGYLLNVQPVIPTSVSKGVNLVWRPVVPIASQPPVVAGGDREAGLGDAFLQMYFTPKDATGLIWGVGPAVTLPTATEDVLGSRKWSAGPCFVALHQANGWTQGTLLIHQASVAGDSDRASVNYSYLQPFVSKTNQKSLSLGMSAEITYNWQADRDKWLAPVYFTASKVVTWGKRPVSIGGGVGYVAEGPESAGDWKARFSLSFLFPK